MSRTSSTPAGPSLSVQPPYNAELRFLLSFERDCIFTPDLMGGQEDVYFCFHLDYDGMRYRRPIDRASAEIKPERFRIIFERLHDKAGSNMYLVVPVLANVGVQAEEDLNAQNNQLIFSLHSMSIALALR